MRLKYVVWYEIWIKYWLFAGYLISVDLRKTIKSISLFSDSCAGHDNNNVYNDILLKSVLITEIKIKLTYFLPRHTNKPVVSIHATIEMFIKKKTEWAHSEWPSLIIMLAHTLIDL